tara:strand:- start:1095 stop:2117 length:1023 start_codon:yes stop_codon:yes gene_type:complete
MNTETMQREFTVLFKGFPDAHGTNQGGCKWEPPNINLHLFGGRENDMLGIYPMVYDPRCKLTIRGPRAYDAERKYENMEPDMWHCIWGAIDIDEGDESIDYAMNAQTILKALDLPSWVEISRSKGCHVWVFAEDWVTSKLMRKVLKGVMQIGKIPYDAVYPKQDSLDGPVGNYMRLPYGCLRPERRQEMRTPSGESIDLESFLYMAMDRRASVAALDAASSLYKEPKPDLPPPREYSKEPLMTPDGGKLRGAARKMYEDGPVDYFRNGQGAGRGRHGFLHRFARAMWESKYQRTDIVSWTTDLDSRLGLWYTEGPKFSGRRDAEKQIQKIVDDAGSRASR